MKSTLTIVFVFLLLGSLVATLGQTSSVPVVQPGGLLEINSSEALCLPTTIALPVSKALTVPFPIELGGCRVSIAQTNGGVFPVRLTQAWTVSSIVTRQSVATLIRGVVPVGLRQGAATIYVERIEPVSDQHGNVTQQVQSVRTINVEVGGAVSSGIVIPTACLGEGLESCYLPDNGFEIMVSIGGGEPVKAKLIGVVNRITLE